MAKEPLPPIECKGCGRDFVPTSSSQRYCPECRSMGYRKAARMAREIDAATRRNFRRHYDLNVQVLTSPCECCGKPVKYIDYGGNSSPCIPKYCSRECQAASHIAATRCAVCGKPMSETNDLRDMNGHVWTCSPECRDARLLAIAREEDDVGTCPVCGKEFPGKDKRRFCSRECYMKDFASKTPKDPVTAHVCPVCGKTYEGKASRKFCSVACSRQGQVRAAARKTPATRTCPVCGTTYNGNAACCSASCYNKLRRRRKAAEAASLRESDLLAMKQKETGYVLRNGLCGICSTPYPDCRRMQSGFTYSPEHALYRNGAIVYCPQFRTTQLKALDADDLASLAEDVKKENVRKLAAAGQTAHGTTDT